MTIKKDQKKIDICDQLQNEYVVKESNLDGKYTKTTQFMLPSIGININNTLIKKYFINAFLKDMNYEIKHEFPVLFLLFKVEDTKSIDWNGLNTSLTSSLNYVNDYDLGTSNCSSLIMFVFSVPEKFHKDYEMFLQSKYSKFSEDYKKKFSELIKDKNGVRESIIYQIINKRDVLKRKLEKIYNLEENFFNEEDELWDIVRIEREYYNY